MMGAAPYYVNTTFHTRDGKSWNEDENHLAQCIADLNLVRAPDLVVVDAGEYLATNGPFGPGKIERGLSVVAGVDRVAIDAYCCRFLKLPPERMALLKKAESNGLGRVDLSGRRILEQEAT